MRRLLQHFLCGIFLLTTAAAFATDCVNCGQKTVAGMPGNTTFDEMEKIVKRGSGKDRTYVMNDYCLRFTQIPQEMVGSTIKDMEKTAITPEEYLTEAICQPRGYSDAVKSPMIHAVADDITKREEFLQNIWLYYSKKRKQPEIFDKAINAKNSKGETLLDYLQHMKKTNYYTEPTQLVALEKIIKMLCAHGGVYAVRQEFKCPTN
jgi:hypothetical protein